MYWPNLDCPGEGLPVIMFNPEIAYEHAVRCNSTEGCLSIIGATHTVRRSVFVEVRGQNIVGKYFTERAKSVLEAAMFQHEIDHLNGILIADRAKFDTEAVI